MTEEIKLAKMDEAVRSSFIQRKLLLNVRLATEERLVVTSASNRFPASIHFAFARSVSKSTT
jgi:hypothetical protein